MSIICVSFHRHRRRRHRHRAAAYDIAVVVPFTKNQLRKCRRRRTITTPTTIRTITITTTIITVMINNGVMVAHLFVNIYLH